MKYKVEVHVRESRMELTIMQGEEFNSMQGFSIPINQAQAHAIAEMLERGRGHPTNGLFKSGSFHEEFSLS